MGFEVPSAQNKHCARGGVLRSQPKLVAIPDQLQQSERGFALNLFYLPKIFPEEGLKNTA